jgi:hypothetical protein
MLRYVLASGLILMLAAPATAAVHNNGPSQIDIQLQIPCYTNVYWNSPGSSHDGDDTLILFNNGVRPGDSYGDFWNSTLMGAYGDPVSGKSSQDAFATDYYESYDQALFWLESNCCVTMVMTPGGDLACGPNTLPSWFTVSLTNNTGTADGFIDGGARQSCGAVPLDGPGVYLFDAGSGVAGMDDRDDPTCSHHWPNQHPFPMTGGPWTTTFNQYCQGTVLFLCRVFRSGLQDAGGVYTGSIGLTFTDAPCCP